MTISLHVIGGRSGGGRLVASRSVKPALHQGSCWPGGCSHETELRSLSFRQSRVARDFGSGLGFVPLREPQIVGCAGDRWLQRYPPNRNVGAARHTTEGLETGRASGFQRRSAVLEVKAETAQPIPGAEASTWPPGSSPRRDRAAVASWPQRMPLAGSMWVAPVVMIIR
jgi:hypothetical protein